MNDHEDGNGSKDNLREQDIYLPIANVARIMKNAVPPSGKVPLAELVLVLRMGPVAGCLTCPGLQLFPHLPHACFGTATRGATPSDQNIDMLGSLTQLGFLVLPITEILGIPSPLLFLLGKV